MTRYAWSRRASRREAVAVTPFVLPETPRGRLCKAGRAARLRVAVKITSADASPEPAALIG